MNRYQERQARKALETYENGKVYSSIWNAYNKPSSAKESAWEYCRMLCTRKNGWGLSVIGKNTCIFTAGFRFTDQETGVEKFMYITPSYDVEIDI